MEVPLSGDDIIRALNGKVKVIYYTDLDKYRNLEEVLYPYGQTVILYQVNDNFGHWTCVFKYPDKNIVEFFDPYSGKPDSELDFAKASGDDPLLLKLLYDWAQRTGGKVVYSDRDIQRLARNINTCGRHCVFRLRNKHLPIDTYLNCFKTCKDPDKAVTKLVKI